MSDQVGLSAAYSAKKPLHDALESHKDLLSFSAPRNQNFKQRFSDDYTGAS